LSGALIARFAYCEEIDVEFPERCPLRCVRLKLRCVLARYVDMGHAGRRQQHRRYRQPSPTRNAGEPNGQMCLPLQSGIDPDPTAERQTRLEFTNHFPLIIRGCLDGRPSTSYWLDHIGYFGPP
jgi:hypothetical protein